MKPFFGIFFFIVLYTLLAQSKESRVEFLGGIGSATALSAGSAISGTESPGAFGVEIDQNLSGAYYVFAEHLRSLGSTGSSIGFTGLGLKLYPWANPMFIRDLKSLPTQSTLSLEGYFPYFGASFGMAQASMLGSSAVNDVVAVDGYLGLRAGAEHPLSETWGLLSEFNFSLSLIGSGSIQAFNVLFGAYFSF